MNPKFSQSFIPVDKIEAAIQLEPALFILLLSITSWIIYRLFLQGIKPERHRNLRKLFKNLLIHSILGAALFISYLIMVGLIADSDSLNLSRLLPWLGLITIISGAIIFIKTCRILTFEYLFFLNMQVGVPLLLVNLLTLLLSVALVGWIATSIFGFRLVPVLATSAIFSVILGLALQDTLGNLFAGIALQLDKPYGIGDWVEIMNGNQKVVGVVQEITWRATVLISVTEEIILLPNRLIAQSQVSNYSGKTGPVIRSQMFRVPYGVSLKTVRNTLIEIPDNVRGIRKHPEPVVFVSECTDSWLAVKLIYYIDDFGKQFSIADEVISKAVEALIKADIPLASNRMDIFHEAKNISK